MKKLLYLLLACVLCSALVFTACSKDSQEQIDEATEAEVTFWTEYRIATIRVPDIIGYGVEVRCALTDDHQDVGCILIDGYTMGIAFPRLYLHKHHLVEQALVAQQVYQSIVL